MPLTLSKYLEGIVMEVTDTHVLGWKDLRVRGRTDRWFESFYDRQKSIKAEL